MDRAAEMSVLVASVEAGGFTAAAERLGLTPSAVSKAVTRLEARLGVRLLERTTRRLDLTGEGRAYVEAARRILNEIDDLDAEVMARRTEAKGVVRVNAGVAFAIFQLAGALPELRRRHPDITVELAISDHVVDVIASGTDIAIRTGPVADERLVGRKFAEAHRVIAASPAYLARHGTPRAPDDLARHTCINLTAVRHLSLWPFRTKDGVRTRDTSGAVMVDNAIGALELARAGFGIVRLGDIVLKRALETGELVPILTDVHVSEAVPLHLCYPPGRQRLPRVRAVLDFLEATFRDSPWKRVA